MTGNSRSSNRTRAILGAAAAALLAGCSNPPGYESLNMGVDLGPHVPLDTLQPSPPPSGVGASDASTLTGVDRSNWGATTVLVPISGVEHQPHYTHLAPLLSIETARQRGEYPTLQTCLETTTDHSTQRQFGEIFASPFYAGADVLLFIPRTFSAPILSIVESPMDGYQRKPSVVPFISAKPSPEPGTPPSPAPPGVPDIPHQPTPDETRTNKP